MIALLMIRNRYIDSFVQQDLQEKMVMIGGPRQVGKTTLALQFLDPPTKTNPAYLNGAEVS